MFQKNCLKEFRSVGRKRLFANLEQVIPTVNVSLVAENEISEMERGLLDKLNGIAFNLNCFLGMTKMCSIVAKWSKITNDRLMDALIFV